MFKHHSYNNRVEKKLAQLPAADAEGLWSNMEAILDKQMPQKKRRPGLIGWLFMHKAWMLATLAVVTAAGTSLVYFWGGDTGASQHTVLRSADPKQPEAPAPAAPAAPATTADATAAVQGAAAPVAAFPGAPATTTTTSKQNTISVGADPAEATARTLGNVPSSTSNTTAVDKENRNSATASTIPATAPVAGMIGSGQRADADREAGMQWATSTTNIGQPGNIVPAVDPGAVKVHTQMLDSLSQQIASAVAAAERSGRLPQEKGPYVGVVLGVDMSSVEFGSVKTGNNKGLLVGYAFHNRWSVETGVLWNRKNYYADGSLYKADGYTPQPGLTILDVNSINQLYELPVNVKYNILAGRNKLFATAGVSSYIIRKENIDLHYDWNGQQGNQYYDYSNVSKHWLSVASFSLGYTHQVGSFGSLRLEPYLKVPLKEIGISNMRVTSMGLNVVFVRMLRR